MKIEFELNDLKSIYCASEDEDITFDMLREIITEQIIEYVANEEIEKELIDKAIARKFK